MGRENSLALTVTGADRLISLVLVACVGLLAAGLVLPALSVSHLFVRRDYSILSGVTALWQSGDYILAVVVGAFSVLLPTAKALLCGAVWFAVPRQAPQTHRIVTLLARISKWSMLDVFIIALTVLALEGSLLTSADVGIGIVCFAAAVLLSTLCLSRMARLLERPSPAPAGISRGN